MDALRHQGWLGADLRAGSGGVEVLRVHDGSPAQAAGLSAGDLVIAVDGIKAGADLAKVLARRKAGTLVEIHAFRRDELRSYSLTLAEAPADTVVLELDPDASPEAVARLVAWLGPQPTA